MAKSKMLMVRISLEQDNILLAKARSVGFKRKSDYVRSVLFLSMPIEDKINKIYLKVCDNGS